MTEGSIIRMTDLPQHILAADSELAATVAAMNDPECEDRQHHLKTAVHALEKNMIRNALLQGGSTYKAAKHLGISQSTVVRKARGLGIGIVE